MFRRCRILNSLSTSLMSCGGTGDPAAMPVLSLASPKFSGFGRRSSARNIVGTPCKAVHRSFATVSRTSCALKASEGIMKQLPCVRQASMPRTRQKIWKIGGGLQRRSSSVSSMLSPIKRPLFRRPLMVDLVISTSTHTDCSTNLLMCQHRSLWVAGCTTGKL